jgi:DNA (cytosine-5)-methyltransferase 1
MEQQLEAYFKMISPKEGWHSTYSLGVCHQIELSGGVAWERDIFKNGVKVGSVENQGDARAGLVASGKTYVIENVPGAPLINPITLCGSSFGLGVRRHRQFESNMGLMGLECNHKGQGRPIGVYGSLRDEIPKGGRTARTVKEARDAMGIDWMLWGELVEAIPPVYTEHLGKQLLEAIT